jgi:Domain of unknown function (DUF4388)
MAESGLSGRLQDFPVREILELICLSCRTGSMHFSDGARLARIDVQSGNIVCASTSSGYTNLGELLLRHERLTREALEHAIQKQRSGAKREPLGAVLIKLGLVAQEDIRQAMHDQVKEVLLDLMTWPRGEFVFETAPGRETDEITLGVSDMLLEASIDMRALLEDRGADPGVVASPSPPDLPVGEEELASPLDIFSLAPVADMFRVVYVAEGPANEALPDLIGGWAAHAVRARLGHEARAFLRDCGQDTPSPILVLDLSRSRRARRNEVVEEAASLKRGFPHVPALVLHAGLSAGQRRRLIDAGVRSFVDAGTASPAVQVETISRHPGEAFTMLLGQLARTASRRE